MRKGEMDEVDEVDEASGLFERGRDAASSFRFGQYDVDGGALAGLAFGA